MRARAAALIALLAGCGGAAAVRLSDEWPAQPGDYQEVTRSWTRRDKLIRDYDALLDVSATFKSPEWRAAYVARRARDEQLTADEVAALREQEQKEAADHYEVELLVSTYHYRENDLTKGDKSMWRIALVDDRGQQVRPVEIQPDRRPGDLLGAYFPDWQPFHRAYVVRFPKSVDLLRADARRFSLRIGSARGAVELVWQAR